MIKFVLNTFHTFGTAILLILISYLFVSLLTKKKVTVMDIISHLTVMIVLFLTLLRTS